MNIWTIKCSKPIEDRGWGWHWRRYFKGIDEERSKAFDFGGEDWIRSPKSKKYIREEVRKGDLVVCYQKKGREILGLTRMASDGKMYKGSGEYNSFLLAPAIESFDMLRSPVSIQEIRSTGCDPECFRIRVPGTIFPVTSDEFGGVLSAIVTFYPESRNRLTEWLKTVGYDTKQLRLPAPHGKKGLAVRKRRKATSPAKKKVRKPIKAQFAIESAEFGSKLAEVLKFLDQEKTIVPDGMRQDETDFTVMFFTIADKSGIDLEKLKEFRDLLESNRIDYTEKDFLTTDPKEKGKIWDVTGPARKKMGQPIEAQFTIESAEFGSKLVEVLKFLDQEKTIVPGGMPVDETDFTVMFFNVEDKSGIDLEKVKEFRDLLESKRIDYIEGDYFTTDPKEKGVCPTYVAMIWS